MNEKNPFGGLGYLLNKANNQTYFVFAGLSLIFGLFFGLNYLFPIFSDDFNYSFVNNISASERITSLCDIFASQYNHYFNWGGRSVVHTIAQALLLLPLLAAKLLNSGIFTLYIYIIYKIANNGKPANVKSLLIVAIFFWLTIQGFFTVTLWLTGSANYLWGMLIVLLFLYRYYNYYCTGKSSDGFAIAIVYFLFGILSGWTNENMFVAQVFFIVSVFFLYKKNNLTIPKWAIFGLIGVLIGGTMMLLAPGNFVRSEVVAEGLGFADKSFFYTLFYKLGKIFYRYAVYILPITILYFALLFFYLKNTEKSEARTKKLYASFLFFTSAHVAWLAMGASLIFPPRALFGIVSFMVIAFALLYVDFGIPKTNTLRTAFVGLLFLASLGFYVDAYLNLHYLAVNTSKREKYIEEQKEIGNKNIIFNEVLILPSRYYYEDLSNNAQSTVNKMYSTYYELDSVRVEIK